MHQHSLSSTSSSHHDLNNQGCHCQLCQTLIINQNLKISHQKVFDLQSEEFGVSTKQKYIELINQMASWPYKRSLRFMLPQICLYEFSHPICLIQKKKQSGHINLIKSKSKLHFFQIQSFFLNGYINHNPIKKKRESKTQALSKPYINQCIVFAKYKHNFFNMFTYIQIQNLFRSKNKNMREGLMYLQTIIGGQSFKSTIIKIDLDNLQELEDNAYGKFKINELFQRAKNQVKIIINEVKATDQQYYDEQKQILFQNTLKQQHPNLYIIYLSLKIILIASKRSSNIMKKTVFKYNFVNNKFYLFDLRVEQLKPTSTYWTSSVFKALQYKLKKTMSMIQMQNPQTLAKFNISHNNLGIQARKLSKWLDQSTKQEWGQMKIIRTRLQKLQQQKKSLLQSQKQQALKRNFKIRQQKRRQNQTKIDLSKI